MARAWDRTKFIRKILPGAVKTGVLVRVADWDPRSRLLYKLDADLPGEIRDRVVPLYRIVPEGEEVEREDRDRDRDREPDQG